MTTKRRPPIKKKEIPASDNGSITTDQARQLLAEEQRKNQEACQAELANVYKKYNCVPAVFAISPGPENVHLPIGRVLFPGWSVAIVPVANNA